MHNSGLATSSVCNYLSAFKAVMTRFGIDISSFDNVIVVKFLKALSKSPMTRVNFKSTFTIDQLKMLFQINQAMGTTLHMPLLLL